MNTALQHQVEVAVDGRRVIRRRDFLRGVSAASIAAGTLAWKDVMTLEAADLRKRGMACILLWMQGGPSQLETFDPKPDHANGGETKAIDTAAPGVKISENFPRLGKMMKDVAVVRSMTSKEGSHPRATYLLHTGYLPTASVKYPALGSTAAQQLAQPDFDLPSFVRIGSVPNSSSGGLLGVDYDPFVMQGAGKPPANTTPATEADRYVRRIDLLEQLEAESAASDIKAEIADHQKLYRKAARMILSSHMKTFDLEQEPAAMREAYGTTQFGAGCLLARRLIEAGVTFVEVTHGNWDTHDDNFKRSKKLCGDVDRPFAQLLADLKQRGMLDSTLVVWMGEFGRTPRINARTGRDHYPKAFNMALAGGGVRGGRAIGKTDASGAEVSDRPVTVPDLFQSFCKSLKIDPSREAMTSSGRPIKVMDKGQVVSELFA